MKRKLLSGVVMLLSGMVPLGTCAQEVTSVSEAASNSFEKDYKRTNPALIYTYDDAAQTHNYSGNWDLDGDGKKDSVLFAGNGAAHIYYYLKIILSSAVADVNLPMLAFDFPGLGTITALRSSDKTIPDLPQFIVHDFDSDGLADIYLHFDPNFSQVPDTWRKKGIKSGPVILTYKNSNWIVRNYKP